MVEPSRINPPHIPRTHKTGDTGEREGGVGEGGRREGEVETEKG
jgi:hypothetical protein